jgi:hypothetical protein
MTTAALTTKTSSRMRAFAWLPAALLLAVGIAAATGVRLQPSAHAATGTTTVTATISAEVHVTPCASFDIGSVDTIGTLAQGTADCTVVFGSNNGAGSPNVASLTVQNNLAGAKFLCWDTDNIPGNGGRDCATANKQFNDAAGTNAALANNEMGARYNAAPSGASCGTGTWTNGATNFNKIPASGSPTTIMNTTTTGDCTLQIRFGAKNTTLTGNTGTTAYDGQALFTATAL